MAKPAKYKKQKVATKKVQRAWYVRLFTTPHLAKVYALAAVGVLLATTVYWAYMGARIQQGNADQLANTYLFENSTTFHGAYLPAQHSFLIKWPVFLLIKLFGSTSNAFMYATIGLSVLTVTALAYMLFRIERRLLIFGTLCLALASVLLLVPAQPYPGGILPVNMAMVTTRNLEYVVFLAAVTLVAAFPRVKNWRFWLATVLLVTLSASDKLFLTLSIGAALIGLAIYALRRKWALVSLMTNWLLSGVVAAVGATLLLWLCNAHLTHIVGGSGVDPYGVVHSTKGIMLGCVYAVLGLLANFGASPITDARVLSHIQDQVQHNLLTAGGVSYVINAVILASGLLAAGALVWSSLRRHADDSQPHDTPFKISLMLIAATFAASAVFIGSNHYYPVDARYLAIAVFALFISLATFVRSRHWHPRFVVFVGLVLVASVLAGMHTARQSYLDEKQAMAGVNKRNYLVAQAVKQHPVSVLVGDYWRVLPIRRASKNALHTMPLTTCTQPLQTLSSAAWQQNVHNKSFAYLISFDPSLTGYPKCSLNDVVAAYGHPNSSAVIAGTLKEPKEMLLFYDSGVHKAPLEPTAQPSQQLSTVFPTPLSALPNTTCSVPTIMNVVAHQDDDLLFMNPDTLHDIKAGHCIRTIYVTSGDAGGSKFYWLGREKGSEAAYADMLGVKDIWVQRVAKLSDHQFVSVASPLSNPKVSLIFMHLPDGNVHGSGFAATHHESLERLDKGAVDKLHAVDGQSTYTSDELTNALAQLMHAYNPAAIRTQANLVSDTYPDHSDHMAVGRYTKHAYQRYIQEQYEGAVQIPLSFYVGYPIHTMSANVFGTDLDEKERAFLKYAKFDDGVCGSTPICLRNTVYEYYVNRQYTNSY